MAHTFTSRIVSGITTWDFKVNTLTLTLSEGNVFHNSVLNLLKNPINGIYYRNYLEELCLVELQQGIRPSLPKFVDTFKNTLGFDTIPDPEVPIEIIEE
jgi:hypothetical protein